MRTVIFLGSKKIGYECLRFLLSNSATLKINIIGVFSKKSNLDTKSYSIEQLSSSFGLKIYDSLSFLEDLPKADFLISVQYHEILKAKHLAKAEKLAINLHMAPVPEYRGCNQFSFAILDQASEFGTTLHKMDTSIDGGDILFEKRFPIPENCWVKELHELTYQHSLELFKTKIGDIFSENYEATPQNSFPDRKAGFHLRKEINDIKKIDLAWDKDKIERHIRATYFPPFEPPYFMMNGKKVYFNLSCFPQE